MQTISSLTFVNAPSVLEDNVSEEKLLHFHVFRSSIYHHPPDKRYCVASVYGERVSHWQCTRKPVLQYGGHGWCKQHYPPNEHARKLAREAEWKAKWAADNAKWAAKAAAEKLKDDALNAIRKIAAGHNDPRALAQEVLSPTDGAKPATE